MFTLICTKTPQNGGFRKRHQKRISTKTMGLITQLINVNVQKRRFLKTVQDSTKTFIKPKQCERTKTDIFGSVFVIFWINVNGQKRMFFTPFLCKKRSNVNGKLRCNKNGYQQKRSNVNGALLSEPISLLSSFHLISISFNSFTEGFVT